MPEDVRVRALAAGRADEDAVSLVPGSFEVGYVVEDGSAHRVALTDARAVRFEATAPVRRFYSRKAQRHLPGRWWLATDGVHVGYEPCPGCPSLDGAGSAVLTEALRSSLGLTP